VLNPERLPDMLVLGQQTVDVSNQPLKP